MRSAAPQARRSHDRADRHARRQRLLRAAVAGLVVIAILTGVWLLRDGEPSRDGAPHWVPDGRSLVFISEVGERMGDIYRMNLDGSGRRRLTDHAAIDGAPAVSPDGTRIAFESERDGNSEIYVMDVDGRNVRRLTSHPARDSSPAWSPDGQRLAFTSDRENRASADVWIMNADGTGLERITDDLANWAPQFSPDGRQLAVQVNRDVVVIDLETRARRRLTSAPERDGMNPTWSPDGRRIAFVTTRNRRAEIFTMDADGSNQQLLVSMAAGNVIDPRWSPDGRYVAFVLVPDIPPEAAGERRAEYAPAIYTVEVDTGVVTRISR